MCCCYRISYRMRRGKQYACSHYSNSYSYPYGYADAYTYGDQYSEAYCDSHSQTHIHSQTQGYGCSVCFGDKNG